ncbi:MAG: HNH endonuclease signature motif containing protein [Candidatus Gracilibacteria bacterium]|jgi:hypothetical protein
MEYLPNITDENLFVLCREYGKNALLWRRKFIGLLPEVSRRRLYERKGFLSIYEFAAKLAGVSERQVDTALNLDRKLQKTPKLKRLFNDGTVSINKLERVVSIVTPENEEAISEMSIMLSQNALEVYAKDVKKAKAQKVAAEAALPNSLFDSNLMRAQKKLDFIISDEVTDKLNLLHAQGKDISALLLNFLNQKNEKIEKKEQELSESAREETHLPSRNYYKKVVRDFLDEKYGKKCAVSGCTKPAEEIHHKIRFGLQANNDPAYLVPLCKEHHQIAHAIDLIVVNKWRS